MKIAASLAILALINNVQSATLKDDDLFTDDGEALETLHSIKAAEKIHNQHMQVLKEDDQKDAITDKSDMQFQGDEFVKNDIKKYSANLLQLKSQIKYKQPKPIGEMMAQIKDSEEVQNSVMVSRTAVQDAQVLAGSSLNDEEDEETTLDSIKSAERMTGGKMIQPTTNYA